MKEQELNKEIEKKEQEYIKKGKSYLILTTPSIIKLKAQLKGYQEAKQDFEKMLNEFIEQGDWRRETRGSILNRINELKSKLKGERK